MVDSERTEDNLQKKMREQIVEVRSTPKEEVEEERKTISRMRTMTREDGVLGQTGVYTREQLIINQSGKSTTSEIIKCTKTKSQVR